MSLKPSVAALAFASLLLGACTETDIEITHDGDAAAVSLGIPSTLTQARAVDPAALELEVSIDNRSVDMNRVEGTARWTGTLTVAPGQYNVEARWFETIDGRADRLVLGSASDLVSMVGSRPVRLAIGSQNFDSSFDIDLDGWFNLHERELDTDPYEFTSPGAEPVMTMMTLGLNLPDELQNDGLDGSNLTATAFVNGLGVPLNRQSDVWIGTTSVATNARAFVRINWYQDSSRQLLFGRSQQAINVGENAVYTPDLSSYRWDYDANSNGRSNLDEALSGN